MLFNYTVILFLSCAAMGQDNDLARTRRWGKQSGSFQLSISSDKAQYSADDVIHITAVLRNVTDHPTRLVVTSPVESGRRKRSPVFYCASLAGPNPPRPMLS